MEADVSQLRALSADLTKAGVTAQAKASQVVRRTALGIERDAKGGAPVDTGNLRNSISTTVTGGGLSAEIGPTAHYGIYVEMGTRYMRDQPYMLPAATRWEGPFTQGMEQIGGEVL